MLTAKLHTHEQYDQFRQLFGVNLRTYWDNANSQLLFGKLRNFIGFDLIKFDDEVVKPKAGVLKAFNERSEIGVSTRQAVRKKWGKEGVELIEGLIGYNKQGVSNG